MSFLYVISFFFFEFYLLYNFVSKFLLNLWDRICDKKNKNKKNTGKISFTEISKSLIKYG